MFRTQVFNVPVATEQVSAHEVFREGAENSARGGRAPPFNSAVSIALLVTFILFAGEYARVLRSVQRKRMSPMKGKDEL